MENVIYERHQFGQTWGQKEPAWSKGPHSKGRMFVSNKEFKKLAKETIDEAGRYMRGLSLYKELTPSYRGFNLSGYSAGGTDGFDIDITNYEFEWPTYDEEDPLLLLTFTIEDNQTDLECIYRFKRGFKFSYGSDFNKKVSYDGKEMTKGEIFKTRINDNTKKIEGLVEKVNKYAQGVFSKKYLDFSVKKAKN